MMVDLLLALVWTLTPAPPQPDLETLLRRAGEYAVEYHDRFTALIADERYVQRMGPDPRRPLRGRVYVERERTLESEYAIVRDYTGAGSWLGVRDVIKVNGEPVTADRARLRALLEDTSQPVWQRFRTLADLQAKYNLGDIYRTINVPTLPLEFLLPDRQPRFKFRNLGLTKYEGHDAVRVGFREREKPTIIRSPEGRNVVSEGVFWLDPASAAVLRTELRVTPSFGPAVDVTIVVRYRAHERIGMMLPDDMNEMYFARGSRIEGHAVYTNYRRFETEVRIK